jgi:hypothetical protein
MLKTEFGQMIGGPLADELIVGADGDYFSR